MPKIAANPSLMFNKVPFWHVSPLPLNRFYFSSTFRTQLVAELSLDKTMLQDVLRKKWYRLYKEEGLALKKRPQKRRKAIRHREERFRPTAPDQAWSVDFVADQLQDGRRFRSLTIVDVFTRESVAIEVGQGLRGEHVVRTLNRLKHEGRTPKLLFCDNGSEFSGQAMDLWAYQNGTKIDFSRPGKPTDNAFVEGVQRNLPR